MRLTLFKAHVDSREYEVKDVQQEGVYSPRVAMLVYAPYPRDSFRIDGGLWNSQTEHYIEPALDYFASLGYKTQRNKNE